MEDCIIFEIGKSPYVDQIDPGQTSVSFGKDDKGIGVWRRIGSASISSPGHEEKYYYVSEHADPPSRELVREAIRVLKPKPYAKH